LRFATFAVGVLWLAGCGRAKSPPHPNLNVGGSLGAGGHAAGAGGSAGSPVDAAGGSGEQSNAGQSAGGAPPGGAGGASGEEGESSPLSELPLPSGCRATQGAATELLCSLDIVCNAVPQAMHCYHTASGAWQCTCEPPNTNKTFLIDGAAGLDACAVGAALCAGPGPEVAIDVPSCELTRDEQGTERLGGPSCTIQLSCSTPVAVDFAPGVSVTMPGVGLTHCVDVSSQGWQSAQRRVDCEASGSLGTASYAVVANGVASACRPVAEFYLGAKQLEYGQTACVRENRDLGSRDSCVLSETCFDSAPMSHGVSAVKDPLVRSAYCGFDDFDNLACGCNFESAGDDPSIPRTDNFNFDLGPSVRPAKCDLSDCRPEMSAEATGPGACQPQEFPSDYDANSCRGYYACTQPATLDGGEVTIYSQLNVLCARADDQAFYCGCAAGNETATFKAGELPTSLDACDLARTDCLEHLALPLAPASKVATPPDPLLGL